MEKAQCHRGGGTFHIRDLPLGNILAPDPLVHVLERGIGFRSQRENPDLRGVDLGHGR